MAVRSVTLALARLRQKNHKLEASCGYILRDPVSEATLLGVIVHTFNPRTPETEAGGSL